MSTASLLDRAEATTDARTTATAARQLRTTQDLRDSEALRQRVAGQLSHVQASLDALLVDRPRRRILRPASGEA